MIQVGWKGAAEGTLYTFTAYEELPHDGLNHFDNNNRTYFVLRKSHENWLAMEVAVENDQTLVFQWLQPRFSLHHFSPHNPKLVKLQPVRYYNRCLISVYER